MWKDGGYGGGGGHDGRCYHLKYSICHGRGYHLHHRDR